LEEGGSAFYYFLLLLTVFNVVSDWKPLATAGMKSQSKFNSFMVSILVSTSPRLFARVLKRTHNPAHAATGGQR
jgi:hypothetical protein